MATHTRAELHALADSLAVALSTPAATTLPRLLDDPAAVEDGLLDYDVDPDCERADAPFFGILWDAVEAALDASTAPGSISPRRPVRAPAPSHTLRRGPQSADQP